MNAIRRFFGIGCRRSVFFYEALGNEIYETFKRAKSEEIVEYQMKVTDWELERYLELA